MCSSDLVFLARCEWQGQCRLNGNDVEIISPSLSPQNEWTPQKLSANANQSYQGSIVLGMGFTLDEDEAMALVNKDAKNADVLFPYLNGEDLNSDSHQKPSRWVINFFDWSIERAKQYADLFSIVEEKVLPDRSLNNDKIARDFWWRFLRSRSEMYHAIGRGGSFEKHPKGWSDVPVQEKILVTARTQNFLKWAILPSKQVFADRLVILTVPISNFALLSSSIFQEWTRRTSTTLKFDINFTPSLTYETFPFPLSPLPQLESLGEQLDALRRQIMTSRNIGLTALYNLFHNPAEKDSELEEMRKLQREIDEAVRDAYGWSNIDLGHGFHEVGYLPANDNVRYTISEPDRKSVV